MSALIEPLLQSEAVAMGGLSRPLQEALERVARGHQLERLIALARQVQQTCADIPELRLEVRDVLATCSRRLMLAQNFCGVKCGVGVLENDGNIR